VILDSCSLSECDLIESVQYESARVVTGAMRGTSRSRLSDELAWEDMNTRRSMHKLVLYYKIVNNLTPSFFFRLVTPNGAKVGPFSEKLCKFYLLYVKD
jgi:hypothetical protein